MVFGGRLGTNLVELGYLRIDELEQHLSGQLGVPICPGRWLERPGQEALRAVPAPLVERYRVLPLALEKRTLHLAMLDPRDPRQLDDIAFATGLRIQPYVMAEVRLSALLEHHFGIPRDLRYICVSHEEARGRFAAQRTEPPGDPGGEADAQASRGGSEAVGDAAAAGDERGAGAEAEWRLTRLPAPDPASQGSARPAVNAR